MLGQFRVSLDGASKDVHEYTRGKNTFDRALAAMQLLIKNHFPIGIGFTVYDENVNEIEGIVRLGIDTGCSYIRFSPVVRLEIK